MVAAAGAGSHALWYVRLTQQLRVENQRLGVADRRIPALLLPDAHQPYSYALQLPVANDGQAEDWAGAATSDAGVGGLAESGRGVDFRVAELDHTANFVRPKFGAQPGISRGDVGGGRRHTGGVCVSSDRTGETRRVAIEEMVGPAGIEPATLSLEG